MSRQNTIISNSIKWVKNTELITLKLHLIAVNSRELTLHYTQALHGWFLKQIEQIDPNLSQQLHDNPENKAFTISRLQGDLVFLKKQVQITRGDNYYLLISALSKPVIDCLKKWLKTSPKSLSIYNLSFTINQIVVEHKATTYKKLITDILKKNFTFSFISPTSFHRKGYDFPFPLPYNLFDSYLRRWQNFSGQSYDSDDFLSWIDTHVLISRHQLQSCKVPAGKKGFITAFTGAIEIKLAKEALKNEEYYRLYSALGKYAPYCGTGYKTTFGLGQTRHGWLIEKAFSPDVAVETLLAKRIEELNNIFLSGQKRPSGKRAINICYRRAEILARREFGESINAIALDLGMKYETVKTDLKVARRILKRPIQ